MVDFTDDTTGAPHDIAKSHVSMYVNEVGHNSNLVENVEVRCQCRSPSYIRMCQNRFKRSYLSKGLESNTAISHILHPHKQTISEGRNTRAAYELQGKLNDSTCDKILI